MSLGNNRDYKTTHRRAAKNLATHKRIMDNLVAEGMDREEASKAALQQMENKRAYPVARPGR